MSLANARLLRIAAGLVATGAMVLGSTTAADATESSSDRHTPVINVNVTTTDGFTLPSTVRAGIVTFKITSQDLDSHAIQGFRVQPGSTVDAVMHDFDLGLLGDYPDRAVGATQLLTDATLVGGAVTVPFASISVTVSLEPGTYYFFDLNDLGTVPARIHTIKAVGRYQRSELPEVDKVIRTTMANGQPRFITPTNFSATGTFLYINNGDEIHEVVFRPTTTGITDDYITAFYDAVLAGGVRPPSPWTDVQHGLQAISPGRWAIVRLDLPPGSYAEICYVPDDVLGIPHSYEGMHQMVTLH